MTANSIERNKERFDSLPQDFQRAIRTSDYDLELATIAKKYKLHIDQSANLEETLAKFIFGEIESSDLISEMESKVNIPRDTAVEMVKEIDHGNTSRDQKAPIEQV